MLDGLTKKTMELLNLKDIHLARSIISTIASELETQICKDMQEECFNQARTIDEYVAENRRLTARITELELSSGYRTGASDKLRSLAIGETLDFPAGDQYPKIAKRLWNIAKAAGVKTKQRSIQKNGMIYVKVERVL